MSHEIVNNPMVEVGNEEEGFVNIDELTIGVDMLLAEHMEELEHLSDTGHLNRSTEAQPFNQQHRNDKSTKKFYTHWDYEKIEQEISQLPEQDTESRNKSVRKILRAINNLDAQDYWWDMCEPRPPNDESIAAKVLGQPATTDNTSGLSRSEQRREKWAQRQKKMKARRGDIDISTAYTADGIRQDINHEDESFIIEDLNGIPIVINLVNAFSSENTQKYTDMILELSEKVKLSTKQADKNGRGSGYCIREGYYAGCINMAYAWVALLKKKSEQAPSAGIVNGGQISLTKSVLAFSSIQDHLKKSRFISTLVNYAMYRCHPAAFEAYVACSSRIRRQIAAAAAVATHDPSLSSESQLL
ncbi:hypothetical protein RhiLY_05479 [Ceratobasidium sp. AG-Ba]|nr:hypothetical protein RhiLY_05479 [Ceratobasidium sp. AG-Ba]